MADKVDVVELRVLARELGCNVGMLYSRFMGKDPKNGEQRVSLVKAEGVVVGREVAEELRSWYFGYPQWVREKLGNAKLREQTVWKEILKVVPPGGVAWKVARGKVKDELVIAGVNVSEAKLASYGDEIQMGWWCVKKERGGVEWRVGLPKH